MKRILRILAIFLIVLLLSGCSRHSKSYSFSNRNEPIESVELLYYPWYLDHDKEFMVFQTIRTLTPEEIPSFMEELYSLPTKRAGPTPLSNYGAYIVRVTYENGEIENFGSFHIEFLEKDEEAFAIGTYYFPGDDFENLFFTYAGDISHLEEE